MNDHETNFTRRKLSRKTALLNTTALITFDRASENYLPYFKRFFDETLTLDFILTEEIVFERRIRDAISKGHLITYHVESNDVAEAEKLLGKWTGLALAGALMITVSLKFLKKSEVFVVTDDLIERKVAEENNLNTLWTSTVAVIFHYLHFTSLPRYIKDVEKKKVLWVSKKVSRSLKLFENKEAMEILLSLHEAPKSPRNLASHYSNNLVNALIKTGIIILRQGKYSLNERHDISKLVPNIKMLSPLHQAP